MENIIDEVLSFLILLVEIVARITADEFRSHEIDALEEKIIKFLDVRKELPSQNTILWCIMVRLYDYMDPLSCIGQRALRVNIE